MYEGEKTVWTHLPSNIFLHFLYYDLCMWKYNIFLENINFPRTFQKPTSLSAITFFLAELYIFSGVLLVRQLIKWITWSPHSPTTYGAYGFKVCVFYLFFFSQFPFLLLYWGFVTIKSWIKYFVLNLRFPCQMDYKLSIFFPFLPLQIVSIWYFHYNNFLWAIRQNYESNINFSF